MIRLNYRCQCADGTQPLVEDRILAIPPTNMIGLEAAWTASKLEMPRGGLIPGCG